MKFGTLLMIGFWLSAFGGLVGGILWMKSRQRNPAPKDVIRRSLQQRLDAGELDQDEYDRRIRDLDRET